MSAEALQTLLVLVAAVMLFVSEKLPMDVVAMLVLASLMLLGLVTPVEALSGFSNEATITVAGMFVLSAGLAHTGALEGLGRLLARVRSRWLFVLLLVSTAGAASAFINNTAVVAVFLPMVLAACISNGLSSSQVLIPLSYAAQMGGVCTLVGTSTNLLVNSLAKDLGHPGFQLFDFLPLGMVTMGVGLSYVIIAGRWLLPAHTTDPLVASTGKLEKGQAVIEVMLAPGARTGGRTLADLRLGPLYGANALALHRHGEVLHEHLDELHLGVGDVLLLRVPRTALASLRKDDRLITLGQAPDSSRPLGRAWLALLIVAAAIASAGLGILPIVAATILGGIALVATRCIGNEQAYRAVDWRVIVLLAGVLPLGIAMQKSGLAANAANLAIHLVGGLGPLAVLAAIYFLTALLTEFMSNNAAAVLVTPIAFSTALSLGVNTTPFLVAVLFAASTSFSTPVGYQTNMMVYNAGNYRFTDFLRMGIPLNLLFWGLAVALIPHYFPF